MTDRGSFRDTIPHSLLWLCNGTLDNPIFPWNFKFPVVVGFQTYGRQCLDRSLVRRGTRVVSLDSRDRGSIGLVVPLDLSHSHSYSSSHSTSLTHTHTRPPTRPLSHSHLSSHSLTRAPVRRMVPVTWGPVDGRRLVTREDEVWRPRGPPPCVVVLSTVSSRVKMCAGVRPSPLHVWVRSRYSKEVPPPVNEPPSFSLSPSPTSPFRRTSDPPKDVKSPFSTSHPTFDHYFLPVQGVSWPWGSRQKSPIPADSLST